MGAPTWRSLGSWRKASSPEKQGPKFRVREQEGRNCGPKGRAWQGGLAIGVVAAGGKRVMYRAFQARDSIAGYIKWCDAEEMAS